MAIALSEHVDTVIEVEVVRDRAAISINGELYWMNRNELEALRHKLMLAARKVGMAASAAAPIVIPDQR